MKLTAKTDLEVPAAFVFATLVDHASWEREAVRNGAEVERPEGTPPPAWVPPGGSAGSSVASRARCCWIEELVENQRVVLSIDSPSIEGFAVRVMVLSPRRSRLRVDVESSPRRLRRGCSSTPCGWPRARFRPSSKAAGQIGGRIKDRYERSQVQAYA
jgi:hypothetical protein